MTYRITPENLIYHTLIGLKTVVAESTNSDMVGIRGVVVDETRNTLVINQGLSIVKNRVRTALRAGIDNALNGNRRQNGGNLRLSEDDMRPKEGNMKSSEDLIDKTIPKSHSTFIFSLPDG
ncbi:MAG: ribonuclease P protein subunit, partial [archaeon]|nr:ribonuclease P protein subunit [archaeon]